jgi:cbb3-type cytochrome oxidase subunit 3
VIVFVAVTSRVMRRKARVQCDEAAQLPLFDDTAGEAGVSARRA